MKEPARPPHSSHARIGKRSAQALTGRRHQGSKPDGRQLPEVGGMSLTICSIRWRSKLMPKFELDQRFKRKVFRTLSASAPPAISHRLGHLIPFGALCTAPTALTQWLLILASRTDRSTVASPRSWAEEDRKICRCGEDSQCGTPWSSKSQRVLLPRATEGDAAAIGMSLNAYVGCELIRKPRLGNRRSGEARRCPDPSRCSRCRRDD